MCITTNITIQTCAKFRTRKISFTEKSCGLASFAYLFERMRNYHFAKFRCKQQIPFAEKVISETLYHRYGRSEGGGGYAVVDPVMIKNTNIYHFNRLKSISFHWEGGGAKTRRFTAWTAFNRKNLEGPEHREQKLTAAIRGFYYWSFSNSHKKQEISTIATSSRLFL